MCKQYRIDGITLERFFYVSPFVCVSRLMMTGCHSWIWVTLVGGGTFKKVARPRSFDRVDWREAVVWNVARVV